MQARISQTTENIQNCGSLQSQKSQLILCPKQERKKKNYCYSKCFSLKLSKLKARPVTKVRRGVEGMALKTIVSDGLKVAITKIRERIIG